MNTSTAVPGQRRQGCRPLIRMCRCLATGLAAPALLLWTAGSAADTGARVDVLMQSVPFRSDASWYDEVFAAMRELNANDEISVPVPRLLEALSDRDVATRRGAARVLAEISRRWGEPEQPAEFRSALIGALQDRDSQVREGIVLALDGVRPFRSVEPTLMVALDDPDARVRWAAARALTGWNRSESVADSLASALSDPDARVRLAAAYAIQRFEAESAAAMPMIVDRLQSSDPAVRLAAAEQFQFFWYAAFPDGSFSKGAGDGIIRLLIAMMDDPEDRIRLIGVGSLSRILFIADQHPVRPEAGPLLAPLATAISDRDPRVREAAAWALRSLGGAASPALDTLDSALNRESDLDARWAMGMAHQVVANRLGWDEARTALVPRSEWYDRTLCMTREDAAIAGLRPGDPERKVADLLGEPSRVTAGEREDDGGGYIVYTYHYPELKVDIARGVVERLSTRSPALPTGRGLHTGLTREEVLALFGTAPTTGAKTARRFSGSICDTEYYDTIYMRLTFDEAGVLDRIEWVMEGP